MGIDIVLLVINAALGALTSSGKVPSVVEQLVSSLGPVIEKAIQGIQSGSGKLEDVVTALGSLSGVIGVLKSQTGLDPAILAQVNVYDQAIQQGTAGYLDSKSGIDLSKLGTVAPIA